MGSKKFKVMSRSAQESSRSANTVPSGLRSLFTTSVVNPAPGGRGFNGHGELESEDESDGSDSCAEHAIETLFRHFEKSTIPTQASSVKTEDDARSSFLSAEVAKAGCSREKKRENHRYQFSDDNDQSHGGYDSDADYPPGAQRSEREVALILAQQYPEKELEGHELSAKQKLGFAAMTALQIVGPLPISLKSLADGLAGGGRVLRPQSNGDVSFSQRAVSGASFDVGYGQPQETSALSSLINKACTTSVPFSYLPLSITLAHMGAGRDVRAGLLLGGVVALSQVVPAGGNAVSDGGHSAGEELEESTSSEEDASAMQPQRSRFVTFARPASRYTYFDWEANHTILHPQNSSITLDLGRKGTFFYALKKAEGDPDWAITNDSVHYSKFSAAPHPLVFSTTPHILLGGDGVTKMLELSNPDVTYRFVSLEAEPLVQMEAAALSLLQNSEQERFISYLSRTADRSKRFKPHPDYVMEYAVTNTSSTYRAYIPVLTHPVIIEHVPKAGLFLEVGENYLDEIIANSPLMKQCQKIKILHRIEDKKRVNSADSMDYFRIDNAKDGEAGDLILKATGSAYTSGAGWSYGVVAIRGDAASKYQWQFQKQCESKIANSTDSVLQVTEMLKQSNLWKLEAGANRSIPPIDFSMQNWPSGVVFEVASAPQEDSNGDFYFALGLVGGNAASRLFFICSERWVAEEIHAQFLIETMEEEKSSIAKVFAANDPDPAVPASLADPEIWFVLEPRKLNFSQALNATTGQLDWRLQGIFERVEDTIFFEFSLYNPYADEGNTLSIRSTWEYATDLYWSFRDTAKEMDATAFDRYCNRGQQNTILPTPFYAHPDVVRAEFKISTITAPVLLHLTQSFATVEVLAFPKWGLSIEIPDQMDPHDLNLSFADFIYLKSGVTTNRQPVVEVTAEMVDSSDTAIFSLKIKSNQIKGFKWKMIGFISGRNKKLAKYPVMANRCFLQVRHYFFLAKMAFLKNRKEEAEEAVTNLIKWMELAIIFDPQQGSVSDILSKLDVTELNGRNFTVETDQYTLPSRIERKFPSRDDCYFRMEWAEQQGEHSDVQWLTKNVLAYLLQDDSFGKDEQRPVEHADIQSSGNSTDFGVPDDIGKSGSAIDGPVEGGVADVKIVGGDKSLGEGFTTKDIAHYTFDTAAPAAGGTFYTVVVKNRVGTYSVIATWRDRTGSIWAENLYRGLAREGVDAVLKFDNPLIALLGLGGSILGWDEDRPIISLLDVLGNALVTAGTVALFVNPAGKAYIVLKLTTKFGVIVVTLANTGNVYRDIEAYLADPSPANRNKLIGSSLKLAGGVMQGVSHSQISKHLPGKWQVSLKKYETPITGVGVGADFTGAVFSVVGDVQEKLESIECNAQWFTHGIGC